MGEGMADGIWNARERGDGWSWRIVRDIGFVNKVHVRVEVVII